MKAHEIKTRAQLVNIICAHTQALECRICKRDMGKLVVIPVDPTPDANIVCLCNDCYVDVIPRTKRTLYTRLKILIGRLQDGQRNSNSGTV